MRGHSGNRLILETSLFHSSSPRIPRTSSGPLSLFAFPLFGVSLGKVLVPFLQEYSLRVRHSWFVAIIGYPEKPRLS
jgi:hypothetical protein